MPFSNLFMGWPSYILMATAMRMWKTNGVLLRNCQIRDIVGQISPSYVYGRRGLWSCPSWLWPAWFVAVIVACRTPCWYVCAGQVRQYLILMQCGQRTTRRRLSRTRIPQQRCSSRRCSLWPVSKLLRTPRRWVVQRSRHNQVRTAHTALHNQPLSL